MDIQNLIKMANQIGDFFGAWPDQDQARAEVAGHLRRFWDPRMRRQLCDHVRATGGTGLTKIVIAAVAELDPAPPPAP
jgi:formate dehydrogenase subunit delta